MRHDTIGGLLEASDGRPAGFDYLRIGLAAGVILWHTTLVSQGRGAETILWTGFWRPVGHLIVPAFFALSGFLVASSLLRNDLVSFAALRVIRLFPALTFEVVISALLIGPIVTVYPLMIYLTKQEFFLYFLNIVGNIHYTLPGVFLDLPFKNVVNQQLWTIPYELECYVTLIVFAIFRLHKHLGLFLLTTILFNILILMVGVWNPERLSFDRAPEGRVLVSCFLYGVYLFLARDRIIVNKWIVAGCAVAFCVMVYSLKAMFFTPALIAYATVSIGLWNRRFAPLIQLSNYSYGMYLYGFPVQQLVSWLFPDYRFPLFNFMLAFPVALLLGFLSWHGLEEKVAARKKQLLAAVHASLHHRRRMLAVSHARRAPVHIE